MKISEMKRMYLDLFSLRRYLADFLGEYPEYQESYIDLYDTLKALALCVDDEILERQRNLHSNSFIGRDTKEKD